MPHALRVERALGGDALDAFAATLLEANGCEFVDARRARRAGERLKRECGVAAWSDGPDVETASCELDAAWLKPGSETTVLIDAADRKRLAEPLFSPKSGNPASTSSGLAALIKQSINQTEPDHRRTSAIPRGIIRPPRDSLV